VIAALARCSDVDIDRAVESIRPAKRGRIHTFIATSDLHLTHKLRMTRETAQQLAIDAVRRASKYTNDIEFSAEDATRSDLDYLCRVVESVIDGAGVLRARRPAGRSLGMHVVAVMAQLATVGCLLHAFGVAAPATAPLLVVAMVTLAGVVPASPGGIGVTQAAIVVPLGATYNVSANLALAFALGLQATILVVAVIGGLAGLAHQRLARPSLAATH
jgi:uncharacterized membrane protein YbhN (UPF0104 family)